MTKDQLVDRKKPIESIAIGTTTPFHLQALASALHRDRVNVTYHSYSPPWRMRRAGLRRPWARSYFYNLFPTSLLAHARGTPFQMNAVHQMMRLMDDHLTSQIEPVSHFVGLSGMSVRSAARASQLGATVIIERGSRHVLSQAALTAGGEPLRQSYIDRELASYEAADYISVLSQHAADSFIERGFAPERILVNPVGVDLGIFKPTPQIGGNLRLLFVGGWTYRKGVDVLAQALKRRPGWHLTHVGTQPEASMTTRNARIKHVGHKTHVELHRLMAENHILVLPSREDGFGMVLLEALASGLPVVGTAFTGAPTLKATLERPCNVQIARPEDVDDLIACIEAAAEVSLRTPVGATRSCLAPPDMAAYGWDGYARRYLAQLTGGGESVESS